MSFFNSDKNYTERRNNAIGYDLSQMKAAYCYLERKNTPFIKQQLQLQKTDRQMKSCSLTLLEYLGPLQLDYPQSGAY